MALLVSPILLFILLLTTQEITLRWGPLASKQKRWEQSLEKHLPGLLEDQKALSQFPDLVDPRSNADAGPFLNLRIRWEYDSGKRYFDGAGSDRIEVSEKLISELQSLKYWPEHAEKIDFSKYNFTWMKELLRFDHWEITTAEPIRSAFLEVLHRRNHMMNYLVQYPLPDYRSLTFLAQIRLMKGLRDGSVIEALREVRHLARLCYSTEELVGGLSALGILNRELSLYEYAVSKKLIHASEWKPPTRGQLRQARKAMMISQGYFEVLAPREMLNQVYKEGASNIGHCIGIRSGTSGAAAVEHHFNRYVPLERDFRPQYQAMREIAISEHGKCRLPDIREYWRGNYDTHTAWTSEPPALGPRLLTGLTLELLSEPIPFLRKISAVDLALINTPDWLEERANRSAPDK